MTHRTCAVVVTAVLLAALAGCETTGDPRQGGLFGWSEAQAKSRQAGLQQEASEATRLAELEKSKTPEMQARQGALRSEVTLLQSQLDKTLSENQRLEAELQALARTKTLRADDLARLRSELAHNERIRKAAQATPAAGAKAPSNVDMVQQQNQRLHKEILFLMER